MMKLFSTLLSLMFLFMMAMLITAFATPPKKIIFFGDSITEAGIQDGGYIARLRNVVKERNSDAQLIGAGIGGNKVYDLFLRLEEDVLRHKPDQVFIYVGVNDVWHKKTSHTGTDADKFERFYSALIRKMMEHGIRVVVCTPAVIGELKDGQNELDADLNKYSDIIRHISRKYGVALCDLRKAFMEKIAATNPQNKASGILTTDTVHLNDAGNQLVASEMLKHLYL